MPCIFHNKPCVFSHALFGPQNQACGTLKIATNFSHESCAAQCLSIGISNAPCASKSCTRTPDFLHSRKNFVLRAADIPVSKTTKSDFTFSNHACKFPLKPRDTKTASTFTVEIPSWRGVEASRKRNVRLPNKSKPS